MQSDYTENDFIWLWDSLLRYPLSELSYRSNAPPLNFVRNTVDKSGMTRNNLLRPDFLCYMQNALVLRGEEKQFSGQINDAADELQSKLGGWSPLFYGSLRFLLGYATGGPNIKYGLILIPYCSN